MQARFCLQSSHRQVHRPARTTDSAPVSCQLCCTSWQRPSRALRPGRACSGLAAAPPQHRPRAAAWRRQPARASLAAGFSVPALLPATSTWGVWAALAVAAAAGLWSEKTRLGRQLSGPLVSTLVGLAASNLGAIPTSAPAYDTVNRYLLPLAVPLLLYSADLRRVLRETGKLLLAFCLGSAATVAGTLVAWRLLPLRSLGADGWKVAAALAARHVGGAVNYVGVADSLGISASAQAAGLAADNLICALYFMGLFWLARNIGPDAGQGPDSGADGTMNEGATRVPNPITVLEGATAVALSFAICYVGSTYARAWGFAGGTIPVVTGITVLLATAVPRLVAPLVASGEGIAAILMHIFFAAVGANGSVRDVVARAPALFLFSAVQIAVHLALLLAAGDALRLGRRDTLLASNACVGGPTTAAGMAAAKGWRSSLVPALLVGTAGYAVATFLGVALGVSVLRHW